MMAGRFASRQRRDAHADATAAVSDADTAGGGLSGHPAWAHMPASLLKGEQGKPTQLRVWTATHSCRRSTLTIWRRLELLTATATLVHSVAHLFADTT